MCFQIRPILRRLCYSFRKVRTKPIPLPVLNYLCTILCYLPGNLNIKHLARFVTHYLIFPTWQLPPVYFYHFHFIRVLNLFQRHPLTTLLSTRLPLTFRLAFSLAVRIT